MNPAVSRPPHESHDLAFGLAALDGALTELAQYLPTVLASIPDDEDLSYGVGGSARGAIRRGQFHERVLRPDLDELEEMLEFARGCAALTAPLRADEALNLLRARRPPAAVPDGDAMPFLTARRNCSYIAILREVAAHATALLHLLDARELHEESIEQQGHRRAQAEVLQGLITQLADE